MVEKPNIQPKRIQLKRVKGWRIRQAVKVSRPTRWGNPFTIATAMEYGFAKDKEQAQKVVVEYFRDWLSGGEHGHAWFSNGADQHAWILGHIQDLRGLDLACWCSLDQPCHADVLLELANA